MKQRTKDRILIYTGAIILFCTLNAYIVNLSHKETENSINNSNKEIVLLRKQMKLVKQNPLEVIGLYDTLKNLKEQKEFYEEQLNHIENSFFYNPFKIFDSFHHSINHVTYKIEQGIEGIYF